MIQHTNTPEFNFNYIDEGIFIGSNVCCQTHFDERLIAEGITADISLEGEEVDTPYGVESYLWLPTPDHHSPTIAQITQGVAQLEALITGVNIITVPGKILREWHAGVMQVPEVDELTHDMLHGDKALLHTPYEEIALDKSVADYDITHPLTGKGLAKFAADWNNLIAE